MLKRDTFLFRSLNGCSLLLITAIDSQIVFTVSRPNLTVLENIFSGISKKRKKDCIQLSPANIYLFKLIETLQKGVKYVQS